MRDMRIAVIGSGGVGGFFGGKLAAAGADVHFLARGAHLDAMRNRGLTIQTAAGEVHVPKVTATDDTSAIGPVDLVLLTVKWYDVDEALSRLPPLLTPSTLIVPFQNGVDSIDRLLAAFPRPQVAGGVALVSAVIAEPGVIRHTALGRMTVGMPDGSPHPLLDAFRDAGTRAGFEAIVSPTIRLDLWLKFIRLSVFSGMTSTVRAPIGVIRQDPALRALMEAAVREAIAVAEAARIPLPAGLYASTLSGLDALPPHAKASMFEDLERGRRLELPWLSGTMVRIGRELGVPTPTHELFVTLLTPFVAGRPVSS